MYVEIYLKGGGACVIGGIWARVCGGGGGHGVLDHEMFYKCIILLLFNTNVFVMAVFICFNYKKIIKTILTKFKVLV